MSFRVRPATGDDFKAIYQMAKLTGGGFTNLPADRGTLVGKLARSDASFTRKKDEQGGDLYMFVLEDPKKRLIAVINYNTDISQYWEWSGRGLRPFDETNEAYKLGVNYVVYGLTH